MIFLYITDVLGCFQWKTACTGRSFFDPIDHPGGEAARLEPELRFPKRAADGWGMVEELLWNQQNMGKKW
jgi:hypothetical protein